MSNKFEERAAKMSKAQVQKVLADVADGFLTIGADYQQALDNRLATLTPRKNAEFPKQAELIKVIKERNALNDKIKALAEEAKSGGFSYRTEVGGRLHNTGRASRGGNGPAGMRGTGSRKNKVMKITTDGQEFDSWVAVAEHYQISPDRLADLEKRNKTNWRKYVIAAKKGGTVTFTDDAMKETYITEKWLDGSEFEIV